MSVQSHNQVETAEALASAFYMMPFSEFLGEGDTPDGHCMYFHLGESPKDMRVTITKPWERDAVEVKAEWRNYATDARNPLKCEQRMITSTFPGSDRADRVASTQATVLNVLRIYQNVLEGTGVAGKISETAPEVEESE